MFTQKPSRFTVGMAKVIFTVDCQGINRAARFSPWIVLVDLDLDAECAPPLRKSWLSKPSHYMCFRIAVRAIEAWLMADRERFARFLSIDIARIPRDVEAVKHPKLYGGRTCQAFTQARNPGRHGTASRERSRSRASLYRTAHRICYEYQNPLAPGSCGWLFGKSQAVFAFPPSP
jgi:hypothetical protein